MVNEVTFPREAAKYISLQRLETQSLGNAIHYSFLGKIVYFIYEKIPFAKSAYRFYSVHIEPKIRSDSIISKYIEVMNREYNTISMHLGSDLEKVVGIGPGVAGLEVILAEKHDNKPKIILIDKSGIDPIHFGFHETAAVYNSLDLAKEILISNGQGNENIELIDAEVGTDAIYKHVGTIDLITSLIAWGFHFPVETYVEVAHEILKPGGRLIMDIRKETNGLDVLGEHFDNVEVILDDPKFHRVLAIK